MNYKKLLPFLIIAALLMVAVAVFAIMTLQPDTESESDTTNADSEEQMLEDGDSMEKDEDAMMDENSEGSMDKDDEKMEEDKMMEDKPGSYIPYDKSSLTAEDNIIFFHAAWCPTCRGLDSAINSDLDSIPADLTILKANYDTETELKQKYGVTYQHTLVQVDENGEMIKKWNGSRNISELLAELA